MGEHGVSPALLRFHIRTGVRVALRTLAPAIAGLSAVMVLYGTPAVVLTPTIATLYPPAPSFSAALVAGLLGISAAIALRPRVVTGVDGWIRHLPASARAHRRAVTVGLAVGLSPLLTIVLVTGLTVLGSSPETTGPRLLVLPILGLSTALAALPVGWRARALATVAANVCFVGTFTTILLAGVLLVAADGVAGEIAARGRSSGRRSKKGLTGAGTTANRLWVAISGRALGWRAIGGLSWSILVLIPVLFFLRNNPLSELQEGLVVRFSALMSGTVVIAALADTLARRRPPWPWVRSLPWSATRRVGLDGAILGVAAAFPVVVAGLLRPLVLPSLLPPLVLVAIRGAAAMRHAPQRSSGASGQILLEGFLCAAAVALIPLSAILVVPLIPVALRLAAASEQEQDVSRWHELHHLAAGDSLSWSDR